MNLREALEEELRRVKWQPKKEEEQKVKSLKIPELPETAMWTENNYHRKLRQTMENLDRDSKGKLLRAVVDLSKDQGLIKAAQELLDRWEGA